MRAFLYHYQYEQAEHGEAGDDPQQPVVEPPRRTESGDAPA